MNEIFDWEQVPESPPPPSYDDDCSIFPPSSHEGLRIEEAFLPQSSRSSVPEGRAADRPLQSSVSRLSVAGESTKQRLLLGFQALYSKLLLRVDGLSFPIWKAIWSWPAAVGGVAGVVFLWWLRRRRAALTNDEERETVIFLIRQNEKKIDQLLQQVAQMKEVMSAQHKVPILRSS